MTAATQRARALRVCLACVAAVLAELLLYLSYRSHDARFHWLTHFLVGASAALVVMTAWAWRTRRPPRVPLVWILLGHIYAMFPDFLFEAGIAHQRWMEVFLSHISSHFVPGRNLTWLLVFSAALAVHLLVLDQLATAGATRGRVSRPG